MIPFKLSGSLIFQWLPRLVFQHEVVTGDQEDPKKQKRHELRESSRMHRTKIEIKTVQM